jgi:hypothetical protein
MDIVIARYNEPIEWTQKIPSTYRVHLYNKGPPLDGPSIQLENIGRESHTYLTHIVRNYDQLAECTIFTQANPFDHVKYANLDVCIWLKKWKREIECYGYTRGQEITTNDDFHWPGEGVTLQDLTLGQWTDKYIDSDTIEFPHVFMYDGACFGIRRELILKRPKAYYQRLLDLHTTINPEESYFMERMWLYVFKVKVPSFLPMNLDLDNMNALDTYFGELQKTNKTSV